jgi:hypothetical protein
MIVLALAGAAQAQTVPAAAPAQTAAPVRQEPTPASKWYLGALSGIQVVDHGAAVAGGEFGIRLRGNVHVVVGATRLWDVVTTSRVDEVNSFATYLQQTQGKPASGSIDAPAWVATAGLRYVHETNAGVRPYVMADVGMGRVEYRPTFILNARDITTAVSQYGVTLGRDLLGPGNHLAYGAGAGLVFGDKWYLDLGVRLTRINTPDHATDVRRISIGMGRRF